MSTSTKAARAALLNLPNQLTVSRLLLSLVLFALLELHLYLASFVVFVIAASTDWLDGYLARKYQLVTTLGRILDPFVDKIIICGTFITLAANQASRVMAWMAVLIVGRELLVTALRSFLEQQGRDFSASLSGKLKMIVQCVAAATCMALLYLDAAGPAVQAAWPAPLASLLWKGLLPLLDTPWLGPCTSVDLLLYLTVGITLYSGVEYVRRATALASG
jgi:CDP-diacylglycerol--glycerol-3-phosphate 3-phosphatidyltransferase